MAFDFATVKALARRTVHETFGVPAFYKETSISTPVECRARWHNRIAMVGDYDDQGYANVIQGIDRVFFQATVARALNVKRGGTISFPSLADIAGNPVEFYIQASQPATGPFEEVWEVSRKES